MCGNGTLGNASSGRFDVSIYAQQRLVHTASGVDDPMGLLVVLLLLMDAALANGEVVECVFLASIAEDHFATQQYFQFSTCALDGNTTNPFGRNVIQLINIPGGSLHRGQRLRLQGRPATSDDVYAEHHARRLKSQPTPGPHWPTWLTSGRGFFVEYVLRLPPMIEAAPDSANGPGARRRRLHSNRGAGRTLLSICMVYEQRSDPCTDAYEPWTKGVPQVHEEAAYSRLEPAWDPKSSRFYIIQMDSAASFLDLSTISCSTFMAQEPPHALKLAREYYPDANLEFSHTEYLVPENLINCDWRGTSEVGTYHPAGVPEALLPEGLQTWCKGNSLAVRAHELGHNMGMMHSSSANCMGFYEYGVHL